METSFITKSPIQYPPKIPDSKTLDGYIKRFSFLARNQFSQKDREKLLLIRDEFKALKEAL